MTSQPSKQFEFLPHFLRVTGLLSSFRVLKNNEFRQYGEDRTQRLVLEAWERLLGSG